MQIYVDDRAVQARFTSMPDKLRAAFLKTYALAEKLKSKVQQNLTNRLLRIRSGKSPMHAIKQNSPHMSASRKLS